MKELIQLRESLKQMYEKSKRVIRIYKKDLRKIDFEIESKHFMPQRGKRKKDDNSDDGQVHGHRHHQSSLANDTCGGNNNNNNNSTCEDGDDPQQQQQKVNRRTTIDSADDLTDGDGDDGDDGDYDNVDNNDMGDDDDNNEEIFDNDDQMNKRKTKNKKKKRNSRGGGGRNKLTRVCRHVVDAQTGQMCLRKGFCPFHHHHYYHHQQQQKSYVNQHVYNSESGNGIGHGGGHSTVARRQTYYYRPMSRYEFFHDAAYDVNRTMIAANKKEKV